MVLCEQVTWVKNFSVQKFSRTRVNGVLVSSYFVKLLFLDSQSKEAEASF